MKKQKEAEPSYLKLNLNWYLPPFPYPERVEKFIVPSELKKEGFTKKAPNVYTKSFDGIVELDIKTGKQKTYHWKIQKDNFLKMLEELRSIKRYVDEEAQKQLQHRGTQKDNSADFIAAVKQTYILKSNFLKKYHAFVGAFSGHMRCDTTYFRRKVFCFDFCSTSSELNLYFEFIADFLYLFAVVKKSALTNRVISPDEIKQALVGYAAVLLCVQKIRRNYQDGDSVEKLKEKYWMFTPDNIEKITSDKTSGKGWEYGAAFFAIEFAVYICSTTEGNFKQILKKESSFYHEIKKLLSTEPEIESFLAGSKPLAVDPKNRLKADIIPKHDWLENFRMALLHFGSEDFLTYNPKGSPSIP